MALIGLSFNNAMHAACSRGVLNGSRVAVAKKRPEQGESIQQPLAAHLCGICGDVALNLLETS